MKLQRAKTRRTGRTELCPACRRWYAVRLDGRIRRHHPVTYSRIRCPGSLAPADLEVEGLTVTRRTA